MPAVTRVGVDKHIGHESPTPNPFHQHPYATGSSDVITNDCQTVRIGDVTECGDPAINGSSTVFIIDLGVHRKDDPTGGHASWIPNASASGSSDVFIEHGEPQFTIYNLTSQPSLPIDSGRATGPVVLGPPNITATPTTATWTQAATNYGATMITDHMDSEYGIAKICEWTNPTTTVDDVLNALYAKVDIKGGDEYIAHLTWWNTRNSINGIPQDITVKMEPEITQTVIGSSGNTKMDLSQFLVNSTLNLLVGSNTVKVYEVYENDIFTNYGQVIIYRKPGNVSEFIASLRQALTDGLNNKTMNLDELIASINSWALPKHKYLTYLNSGTDVYKIPFYIIDYEIDANTRTWVDDIISGNLGSSVLDPSRTGGFQYRDYMVINGLIQGDLAQPVKKLMTAIHESSHFIFDSAPGGSWGAGTTRLFSNDTMQKLHDLWNPSMETFLPKNLEYYQYIPNKCTIPALTITMQGITTTVGAPTITEIHVASMRDLNECRALGGTWTNGGNYFTKEQQHRNDATNLSLPPAARAAALSRQDWPDPFYIKFTTLMGNLHFPILQHLGNLGLATYASQDSDFREDELMARIYSIMATSRCVGFRKDIMPLINDYNRLINGVTFDTIPENEAILVDEEMERLMKLDKRIY